MWKPNTEVRESGIHQVMPLSVTVEAVIDEVAEALYASETGQVAFADYMQYFK